MRTSSFKSKKPSCSLHSRHIRLYNIFFVGCGLFDSLKFQTNSPELPNSPKLSVWTGRGEGGWMWGLGTPVWFERQPQRSTDTCNFWNSAVSCRLFLPSKPNKSLLYFAVIGISRWHVHCVKLRHVWQYLAFHRHHKPSASRHNGSRWRHWWTGHESLIYQQVWLTAFFKKLEELEKSVERISRTNKVHSKQ